MDEKRNEIILFENQGVKLEVNLKDETVWLNLEQMAELFARDKSVISRHIKNALSEELKDEQVIAKFATTTKHGAIQGKTQTHMVDYYNLDMIISIGYRVKSVPGVNMNQKFNYEKWKEKYYNKEYIEIMKFLSKEDIEIAKKLGITIDNKIYTEYELEVVYMKVLNYYKSDEMDKEDLELSKSLDATGVTQKDNDDLLGKIEKINNHYNL